MLDLTGKTALITAAGQGIGRATAELFIEAGAKVIATDINADALASLDGAQTHILNVLDAGAISDCAKQFDEVDILFNCAGLVQHGSIMDTDEAAWDLALSLNVTSMYRMIRAFLPSMVDRKGGSIINMSSVASSIIAAPDRFAYGATKAAVIGLTKAVAVDFIGQGIRCNAICPGTVQSPSLDDRMRAGEDYEATKAAFIARQPMGRIGKPKEIAMIALYLASDGSAFTTGTCHIADGGWSNS